MSTYVLVHGAWFGSWCWDKVVPLLQQQGHTVEAPDLPGYGGDTTPHRDITLQNFVDRVCEVIDRQKGPVVLVGHSRGGIVVTQAAENRSDKIQTLVYLSAFLPRNGESLLQLAQQDTDAPIFGHVTFAEDQGYITFEDTHEAIKDIFCSDCSDEDIARARSRLVPDALAPSVTPVQTTDERFGRIPRVYIECLSDRAIRPPLQRLMCTALPCDVISMNASHSPFLSAPAELVRHLIAVGPTAAVAAG